MKPEGYIQSYVDNTHKRAHSHLPPSSYRRPEAVVGKKKKKKRGRRPRRPPPPPPGSRQHRLAVQKVPFTMHKYVEVFQPPRDNRSSEIIFFSFYPTDSTNERMKTLELPGETRSADHSHSAKNSLSLSVPPSLSHLFSSLFEAQTDVSERTTELCRCG